jgi:hypothetical protein
VPPHLPTTSPVAVAANRILAAYLRNHKLSATEAASLSGAITAVLAALVAGTPATSQPKVADAPAPSRRGAKMASRAASRRRRPHATVESEIETESEAAIDAAVAIGSGAEAPPPEGEPEILAAEPEPEPESAPPAVIEVAAVEPDALLEPVAAVSADAPGKKRKRPSRPRSRRGQGKAAADDDAGENRAAQDGKAQDGEVQDGEASEPEPVAVPHDPLRKADAGDDVEQPPAGEPEKSVLPDRRLRRVRSS